MLIPFSIIWLNRLIIFVTLTGFVCAYKIHAEEECLFSKVWCYECDSRIDPNCADPYDSSPETDYDYHHHSSLDLTSTSLINIANMNHTNNNYDNGTMTGPPLSSIANNINNTDSSNNVTLLHRVERNRNESSSSIPTSRDKQQRGDLHSQMIESTNNDQQHNYQQKIAPISRRPQPQICHGCCVKITSRSIQGVKFIKRTCTTNVQINFFIVDHVCMKESGNRGTMCFCETDYCNGQQSTVKIYHHSAYYLNELITLLASLLSVSFVRILSTD